MSRRLTKRARVALVGGGLGGLVFLSGAGCVTTTPVAPLNLDAGSVLFDGATPTTDAAGPIPDATSPGTDAASGGDGSTGGCPTGWVQGKGGVCVVNMMGSWAPSTDANSDGPDTVAALGTVTATSVSVDQSHTGTDNADCGCNAQHLNIPLGRSFSCATSTLEFSYSTTATMQALDTPALDIRFCTGPCPSVDGGAGGPYFYTGPQFVGSPFAPASSNCAYEWENDAGTASLNYFPASAAIQTGKNTIALGSYAAPASGDACTGTFDTIDVHLQVYNCQAAQTGTSTLADLRIY